MSGCAILAFLVVLGCLQTNAQTWPPAPIPPSPNTPELPQVTVRNLPMNLVKDQGAIWSSPARIRDNDFHYLIPLGLLTTLAITTDHQAMSDVVSHKQTFNNRSTQASNVLLSPFIAAPVVMYAAGHLGDDDHARETGILGGEAMVDSLVVDEAMKLVFMRERPTVDNAKGKWFQTSVGTDSSFPSTHSMIAWSSAAVLADEYPGRWKELGIYGVATGVSLTRVLGQDHFPSDVLVGSAFGWMIGHYVYKKHHRWHILISR
jgi:hypothetical protein